MQVQWLQDPTRVPAPVNQFMIQGGPPVESESVPDTIIITFGHISLPQVPAFERREDVEAFVANNAAIVAQVGQFSFTPRRARELHDKLGEMLNQLGSL